MSRVLFVNGNLHGHINPTLPVVKELVSRGEEVYYFSTKDFQSRLEAYGAIFLDYGRDFDAFLHSFRPHGSHPFYTLLEYMLAFDRVVVPIVLAKCKEIKFDYILHDVMFGAGAILARKLALPAIASCSSFVLEKPPLPSRMLEPGFHPQLDYFYQELSEAKAQWELPDLILSDIFFWKEPRVIVYTSKLFHPQSEAFDSAYRFVGPAIMDRGEAIDFPIRDLTASKLIYISLGTIHNNLTDFYKKCFDAFSGEAVQIILSVGTKTQPESLGTIPDNFIVRSYMPQLEILKRADVFISHGGLNSVSEALFYGVPVIAVPIANDQPIVAKRIEELGAGLALRPEDITPVLLRESVAKIRSNQSFVTCCHEIAASFRALGGYMQAADEILSYVARENFP